jgi:tetratricopeptide (TPR) repeat protein
LAAEQALNRGANPEAAAMVEAGLKLLEKLPEDAELRRGELRLRSIQTALERVIHGAAPMGIDRVISRMCELGEAIGEQGELLRALLALSTLHFTRGEIARGLEVAQRCLHLVESVQDARLRADTYWRAGILAQHSGELREGLRQMEQAMRDSTRASLTLSTLGFSYRILLPTGLAQTLQLLGYSDRSLKMAEEGLRYARESKNLYGLGALLSIIKVSFHCYRREPEIVRLHTAEAILLSEDHGFVEWLHQARFFHGWSLVELGQPEAGIAEMETAAAEFDHHGGSPLRQFTNALLANAYAAIGRTDEGLALLDHALSSIERTGEKIGQAEMLRLKGQMHLQKEGATRKSEECFRAALEVARSKEAKWWDLRTTVSLARLLRDTDRRNEGRAVLAEIYNWFTEGFDTADLKEAKALLDELSR